MDELDVDGEELMCDPVEFGGWLGCVVFHSHREGIVMLVVDLQVGEKKERERE